VTLSPDLRQPAEWEPHEACWLAWPHNPETWPGCLELAEREFRILVATLTDYEPVRLLVKDADHARHVEAQLRPRGRRHPVELFEVPTDDAWMRDIGPTFVATPEARLVAIDWNFNAWGGKYPPWQQDRAVAARVAALAGVELRMGRLTAEGGAFEVDGEGTLIATRTTLLCDSRNPGLTANDIENCLRRALGVRQIVWIDGAIAGDDTDGHVDELVRFVAPGRVVCASESRSDDLNYRSLRAFRDQLAETPDACGRKFEQIDLPMPPRIGVHGARLPASYTNFYIANDAVLVPVFQVGTDAEALAIIRRLFPDREVRGVPSRVLIRGLGSIHCLTQQQPARSGQS